MRSLRGVLLIAMAPLLVSVPAAAGTAAIGAAGLWGIATFTGLVRRVRALAWPRAASSAATRPPIDGGTARGALDDPSWALDAASDAVLVTDLDGRVAHANATARALFGAALHPGASFPTDAAASALDGAADFLRAVRLLYADATASDRGAVGALRDGRPRTLEWASEPIRARDGSIVGRGLVLRDRTEERELASVKQEFLSTVTHELRTPLTSVKGSLQLVLGKTSALSAIERELLAISLKNTDRLIRLINDILDISQLELGKMDLTFAPVAPASLVEEAVAGLRAYAAGRDIAIGCEIEPDLGAVAGDRDRLIQVLTNLLSNAVKFSPTGGRVLVRVAAAGGDLSIAVRDWGVGIRSSDHGRLFQRFQRLHRGRSEEPGTGLGLAISKAIIDRHGGRIVVESAEDAGSTFTVVLPLAAPAMAFLDLQRGAGAVVGPRPTLLLIDDDADFGTVLEVTLGATYRLLRVERGVQALDVARAERPDLILLDVVLPDLSGYDVLRILQHSDATRRIPVVMLTVQPERMLARGLGATDVVAKPVDVDELRRVVEGTLRPAAGASLRVAVGPLPSRAPAALVAALEAGGHAVFTAADPWGLVRCADEHQADVAIVEVRDVGEDGTVAFLRGHATTRRLPLVVLSTAEDAMPGASGCTAAPAGVDDAELVRLVEEAAGRARWRAGDADVA